MNGLEQDWRSIEGFPDYSVNPLGQVRHDRFHRLLHPRFNQYGVAYVGLMGEYSQKNRSLARLVAETFLPTPNQIFDTPINLDGDRANCSVENLMWRPRWYAVRYHQQFTHGRYENPIYEPILATNDPEEIFPDSFTAASRFGLLEREVVMSILNRTLAWPTYQQFELATVA